MGKFLATQASEAVPVVTGGGSKSERVAQEIDAIVESATRTAEERPERGRWSWGWR